jgi:hypothetical protein
MTQFDLSRKYVVLDDGVIDDCLAGTLLVLKGIDAGACVSPGVFGTAYNFDIYFEDGRPIGSCLIPEYQKSRLSKIVPADSPHMVVGREYVCIKAFQASRLLSLVECAVGERCVCTGISGNEFGEGYEISVVGISINVYAIGIEHWFAVENSVSPKRDLSVVAAELYDAFQDQIGMTLAKGHVNTPLDALLAEYRSISGKDKPGFMQ